MELKSILPYPNIDGCHSHNWKMVAHAQVAYSAIRVDFHRM